MSNTDLISIMRKIANDRRKENKPEETYNATVFDILVDRLEKLVNEKGNP